jgi:hypothetical protein
MSAFKLYKQGLEGFTGGDLSAPAAVAPGVDIVGLSNDVYTLRSNHHEPERDQPE